MDFDKASIENFVTAAFDGKPADAADALDAAMEPVVADIVDDARTEVTSNLFGKRPDPEDGEDEEEDVETEEDDDEIVEIDLDQLSDEELDQLVDYLENQDLGDDDEEVDEEEEEEDE